ncbi:DMT family transporter [Iamia sp.]|uniref:DMT family transporter n=1 Tax=Iamia sp. TaxID=2722710 RepID=UPI002C06D65B|nr:DMT family transporter [Iamia sp.]HXH57172.1 DMT family transporter [Iamia sp.]
MAALLALLASLLWGTGDFLGGRLSRTVHPVAVVRATQGIAAVGLVVVVVATGETGRTGAVAWGVAAAVFGSLGVGSFYAALASGTMGVVAPIAATGVVIPVAVGLAGGDSPFAIQLAGIAVTVVGVVLASGPERGRGRAVPAGPGEPSATPTVARRRPLLLAGVAAVGFGTGAALVAEGSQSSVAMTLLVMRVTTTVACTALLLIVVRRAARPGRRDLPVLSVVAVTDAGANGAYAVATTLGQLSVSAVLASLYPAITALLAWRFLHERLRRVQVVGVVTTLLGVAMIAAG